jgi:hypothetical protein
VLVAPGRQDAAHPAGACRHFNWNDDAIRACRDCFEFSSSPLLPLSAPHKAQAIYVSWH